MPIEAAMARVARKQFSPVRRRWFWWGSAQAGMSLVLGEMCWASTWLIAGLGLMEGEKCGDVDGAGVYSASDQSQRLLGDVAGVGWGLMTISITERLVSSGRHRSPAA